MTGTSDENPYGSATRADTGAVRRTDQCAALKRIGIVSPVLLAPMAGITDLPFRRLVASFGAGLTVSEMVGSREVVQARPDARARAQIDAAGGAVQIAGREARWMAEAARMVADAGARIVDINMGCPAKKVTGGLSGSSLMRDPDAALRLVEAVVGAVDVPVTLKMRLGWDDGQRNAADLARRAEQAGVAMIAVHGRTRCQFYKGAADWRAIAEVVRAVDVPVVANGDVTDAASARAALSASGAAAVMIGRGAQGRPWLLAEVAAALDGTPAPLRLRGAALTRMVCAHVEAAMVFYGRDLGARTIRKHLGWYMDAAGTPADLRRAVLTAPPDALGALLGDAFGHVPGGAAAGDATGGRDAAGPRAVAA